MFGEIARQQQQKKQFKRLTKQITPLWNACNKGEVAACNAAATYPLNPQARLQLHQMRARAVSEQQYGWDDYGKDWSACFEGSKFACTRALNYHNISVTDRPKLIKKRNQLLFEARQKRARQEQIRKDEAANQVSAKLNASTMPAKIQKLIYKQRQTITDNVIPSFFLLILGFVIYRYRDFFRNIFKLDQSFVEYVSAQTKTAPDTQASTGSSSDPLTDGVQAQTAQHEPTSPEPEPFPLTGHLPTDVRTVLSM